MSKSKNTTNKNSRNWFDNNLFFDSKDGYEKFIQAMMTAAEEGNLPIALKHEQPEELSMNDVKLFSRRFREDTDLDIEFRLKTCNDCGRLHCIIVVDEVPENEKERDEE